MAIRLYFTRQFTRGTLKGLLHNDSLPFVSTDRAADWLKAVKAKGERGRLPYKIVDASFQNYVRR